MIRFFAVHRTATEGVHLHMCHTSHRRNLADAIAEMHRQRAPLVERGARPAEFYDFGPGDGDLRRLDQLSEIKVAA